MGLYWDARHSSSGGTGLVEEAKSASTPGQYRIVDDLDDAQRAIDHGEFPLLVESDPHALSYWELSRLQEHQYAAPNGTPLFAEGQDGHLAINPAWQKLRMEDVYQDRADNEPEDQVPPPTRASPEPLPEPLPSISPEEGQRMQELRDQHRRSYESTKLQPSEERQFRKDMAASGWAQGYSTRYGETPDLNDPSYDYRGAWKALGRDGLPGDGQHWPDRHDEQWLKSPEHPAAWMEYYQSATGRSPEQDGIKTEDALRSMGDQLPRQDMENPDPNAPETMPLSEYIQNMMGGRSTPSSAGTGVVAQ